MPIRVHPSSLTCSLALFSFFSLSPSGRVLSHGQLINIPQPVVCYDFLIDLYSLELPHLALTIHCGPVCMCMSLPLSLSWYRCVLIYDELCSPSSVLVIIASASDFSVPPTLATFIYHPNKVALTDMSPTAPDHPPTTRSHSL